MTPQRILLLQGHPDAAPVHFGHALADAYVQAARENGREVRRSDIAQLDFPLLRRKEDWDAPLPDSLRAVQADIRWAEHLVLIFPLWLGTMPALLKAFLEQVLRPGFAFVRADESGESWRKGLKGKSARLIVTMGMPGLVYRWFFLAHGVKGMERNILQFCGIKPVRETFIGLVEREASRQRALERMRALGRSGK